MSGAVIVERNCCVRGYMYHVYKDFWKAVIDEELECKCTNSKDRYAVAVFKNGEIVGHLPRKISRVCSLFIRRNYHLLSDRQTMLFHQ